MSLLAKVRSVQARWGRRSLALLVAAWLNLVLQPCAMAMAADAACPACPPAHIHRPTGHTAIALHERAMDSMPHAGSDSETAVRENDSKGATCGGGLLDCVHLEDINQGDRPKTITLGQAPACLAPPSMVSVRPGDRDPPPAFSTGDAARLAGAFPPLNVLYCIYLD